MTVKPIRSEKDHQQALRRIEKLWGSPQATAEGDELEVLATLVEAYEREHYPIGLPDPIEAIKFRLEQSGKGVGALVGVIGQRSRVYEVMRGDRSLSLNMVRKLNEKLQIPAEVPIQPCRRRESEQLRRRSATSRPRPARIRKSA